MAYFHILQVATSEQINETNKIIEITFPFERFLEHTDEAIHEFYKPNNTNLDRLKFYPAIISIEKFVDQISLGKILKIQPNENHKNITIQLKKLHSIKSPLHPSLNDEISTLEEFNKLYKLYESEIDNIKKSLSFSTLELTRFHWAMKKGDLFEEINQTPLSEFSHYKSEFPEYLSNIFPPLTIAPISIELPKISIKAELKLDLKADSVSSFIKHIIKINNEVKKHTDKRELFYRGHGNAKDYRLKPSLLREINGSKPFEDAEDKLFRELLTTEPKSFVQDSSCFDILTRMQHYSLPTRLLDISSNPLTALYFTCNEAEENNGEVIIFSIKKDNIHYFDSDKASCLTNLAKLNKKQKNDLQNIIVQCETHTPPITILDQNHLHNLGYAQLINFIKQEKPYFEPRIKISDLKNILCVKGRLNQDRIVAQSGSFLIFGINASIPEIGNDIFNIHRITIEKDHKTRILQELDLLKINSRTVYPSMENSSKYIKEKLLEDAK